MYVMNEETPVNQMTTVQDITQCIDQSGRNTVLVADEQVLQHQQESKSIHKTC